MGYRPPYRIEGKTRQILPNFHLVTVRTWHYRDGAVIDTHARVAAVAFDAADAARMAAVFTREPVPEPTTPPIGKGGLSG
jgi:hypothetical protein